VALRTQRQRCLLLAHHVQLVRLLVVGSSGLRQAYMAFRLLAAAAAGRARPVEVLHHLRRSVLQLARVPKIHEALHPCSPEAVHHGR
jgi:hypothetical protein